MVEDGTVINIYKREDKLSDGQDRAGAGLMGRNWSGGRRTGEKESKGEEERNARSREAKYDGRGCITKDERVPVPGKRETYRKESFFWSARTDQDRGDGDPNQFETLDLLWRKSGAST